MRMASNIKTNKDHKKIIEWAKVMKEKGIMLAGTTANRIRSLQHISSILGEDEPKDPESLLKGLDDIAGRWARKTSATPLALKTTKSHARGFLSDYIKYQKDPAGFKPPGRGRKPKKEITKPKVTADKKVKKKPEAENEEGAELQRPLLNINIQIHISAETSEKQIDKIFESMAKYVPFKK